MSEPKALVFIAHIEEEKEIALSLKALVEKAFLDMVKFFVSSGPGSISAGQKWLTQVTGALEKCCGAIIVCSPVSVTRPWINFEAGAVYIRKRPDGSDIPVIPLCHSGAEPSKLPIPLNLLEGVKADDESGLNRILPVIAKAMGCSTPSIDFAPFVSNVLDFQGKYTYWNRVNAAFEALHAANPEVIESLRSLKELEMNAPDSSIAEVGRRIAFLAEQKILTIERRPGLKMSNKRGTTLPFALVPLENLGGVFQSPQFVYYQRAPENESGGYDT